MASIEAFFQLQELEAAIKRNSTDAAALDSRLERDEAAEQALALAARAHRALAALESEQFGLDEEVQDTVERLHGLEERLYSGATAASKDLLALQREIAAFQSKQAGLEERLLEKMGQVEAAQGRVAELDAAFHDAEARWRDALPGMREELARLRQQAGDMAAARERAEGSLSAAELKGFRTLEASRGFAVARVERGMCAGCAIAVPSHELQIARTTTTPVRCPNCTRYLYAG